MDESVVKIICTIEAYCKRSYDYFIHERIPSYTKKINNLINKNKFPLYSSQYSTESSSRSVTVKKALKNKVRIFSQVVTAT